ncbi:hypothetical protein N0V94_005557 [Neodidymelliopsis sp. IMI 364377]|nr:hypothetical protein N0V94_005557 [Neodidymelliopsis sp. IMI 364377]
MATLFRDFSFDAASPSLADHEAERALMNCSPTSMPSTPQHPYSRPLTPPPCTMGDLAQIMGGHALLVSTSCSQDLPAGPPTPPSDADTFPAHHLDSHAPRPTYCRASASIMRMQRQANQRLQCCPSQARDISKLVRMIQEEEQCTVSEPPSRTASLPVAESADDEGIDMNYDCPLRVTEPLFSRPLYRAGERIDDRVRVAKSVRMRKRSSTTKDTKERRKTK